MTPTPEAAEAVSYALEILLTIISTFIAILLTCLIRQNSILRTKLDKHILAMVEIMATKTDKSDCNLIRHDCIALNKRLIVEPLEKDLSNLREMIENHSHQGIDGAGKVVIPKGSRN